MVMVVSAAALLLSLVVLLVAGLASRNWETLAPNVADILKSVVLPIVTLVLGYCFGRGGRG
jgi:ABC-type microcin C transport system permease subunit YejB